MRGDSSQIAAEIERRARNFQDGMKQAGRDTQKRGMKICKMASSGNYPEALLIQLGHPYSKKKNAPPLNPGILNYQSGNLFRAWKQRTLSAFCWRVVNTSPEAQEIEERRNPYMIERPVVDYIQGRLRPIFLRLVREASKKAWSGR